MTKLYQLGVKGPLKYFEGSHPMASKKVFLSRQRALDYLPEFIELCTTDTETSLTTLEKVDTHCIVELELDEEET